MSAVATSSSFRSLGGQIAIQAAGEGSEQAISEAEAIIHDLHDRLTRFDPGSELCRLNADPRTSVPASALMIRFAELVREAGEKTGGLVDATLLDQVERAGYVESIDPDAGDRLAPRPSTSAAAAPSAGDWSDVKVVRTTSSVVRPPGVRLDSGGLGKGLAADLVAEHLDGFHNWGVVCAGDLRFGGSDGAPRRIDITSPDGTGRVIAEFTAPAGAVATSGVTRRSWASDSGRSHHLIDPRTGEPAETGLLQVTAIAQTAGEAEFRAKAALLSGPEAASEWLPDGGVIVGEDFGMRTLGPIEEANR
ncbi:MAG: FAD:protein transferase [Actinomycetota bacterium]|jgi:thiamine biosynthesis lipoprotein|nr:FAD:protein transferase [Actinomycetota bacterium]